MTTIANTTRTIYDAVAERIGDLEAVAIEDIKVGDQVLMDTSISFSTPRLRMVTITESTQTKVSWCLSYQVPTALYPNFSYDAQPGHKVWTRRAA